MHAITIDKKISHEFEGDWGGIYGVFGGSKGTNVVIMIAKKKLNKYQKSLPRSTFHDIYTRYTTNEQLALRCTDIRHSTDIKEQSQAKRSIPKGSP